MISKFFTKSGSPQNAIDYLLSDDKENAELIAGDVDDFIAIADSLPYKNKYTSGVLRFKEKITNEQQKNIIEKYDEFLTAGLNFAPETVWVKHTEKGDDELHFVVPNVDLESQRNYVPYNDKVDYFARRELDKSIILEYNFTDPNDPKHQQLVKSDKNYLKYSKNRAEIAKQIDDFIFKKAANSIVTGDVYNREKIKKDLESIGLEVFERGSKKTLSVQAENLKQHIRLKGEMYEPNIRFNSENIAERARLSRSYKQANEARYHEVNSKYQSSLNRKRERTFSKYQKNWENIEKNYHDDINSNININDNFNNDEHLFDTKTDRKIEKSLRDKSENKSIQPSQQVENQKIEQRNVPDFERPKPTPVRLDDREQDSLQNKIKPKNNDENYLADLINKKKEQELKKAEAEIKTEIERQKREDEEKKRQAKSNQNHPKMS